ncbi:MAG: glycosyltransferase family 2 protein [bacterium]|nr:glycosyltransferase family 2 protein [bacterium]MBU1918197.1 glycosyltransferase family 2 protein [bacterium]
MEFHFSDNDLNGVSIIVPTYQEAGNIEQLVTRLTKAMKALTPNFEIIIVDDNSADGSEEIVITLAKQDLPVSILIRTNERGLSSAVLRGFEKAKYNTLVCMDADLSHAPEDVPRLAALIMQDEADFVLGSRYVKGGKIAGKWGLFRYLNSWVATALAYPLVRLRDPMSGFFAIRQSLLPKAEPFNPIGYKIALEVAVKAKPERMQEIPIHFGLREAGESKLSLKEQLFYLQHLKRLYQHRWKTLSQFFLFCLVGTTGLVVDMGTMFVGYGLIGLSFRYMRFLAFLLAATSNYQLNRMITFEVKKGQHWLKQWVGFLAASAIGFVGNWLVSVTLYDKTIFFHDHYLLAVIAGVMAGVVLNFFLSKFAVFESRFFK